MPQHRHPAAAPVVLPLPHQNWGGRPPLPSPMRMASGKRPGRRWLISSLASGGQLLHLYDHRSRCNFLVDTGVEKSMLPHQSSQPPIGPHLVSANGAAIPAWGVQPTSVQFGDNVYCFLFVLAVVPFPIFGADFLAHHRLLVDTHHHRVLRSADL